MKKLLTLIATGICLSSTTNAQTLTGGDMETWKTYSSAGKSLKRPNGWNTSDSLVAFVKLLGGKTFTARVSQSTTVKHAGTSSAKLEATDLTDSLPTIISNGNFTGDLAAIGTGDYSSIKFIGGAAITKRIMFVHSWLQYSYTGTPDTGLVTVTAFKTGFAVGGGDSAIGEGVSNITSLSSFTKIETQVIYKDAINVPDRIVVTFNTSKFLNPLAGTVLYVDDVYLSDPTGIETPLINDERISIFPNPSSNSVQINTNMTETVIAKCYNQLGQMVTKQSVTGASKLDISNWATGSYTLVVEDATTGRKYYSTQLIKQ